MSILVGRWNFEFHYYFGEDALITPIAPFPIMLLPQSVIRSVTGYPEMENHPHRRWPQIPPG